MSVEDGGVLSLTREGRFPIPEGFGTATTMRTWRRTVVFHKEASTEYDTEHPELHPDDREFYVEFEPHGEGRVVRYRIEPEVDGG